METWKEIICLKSYGTHSPKLADEIATLARRRHDKHYSTRSDNAFNELNRNDIHYSIQSDNAFNKLNRKVHLGNIKRLSAHVHLPTQQLQHSCHATSGKWGRPHTVTGRCDTR